MNLARAGLLLLLSFAACKMVDVATNPVRMKVRIEGPSDLLVEGIESGEMKPIQASDGVYPLNVPTMHGGYSKCLFITYNVRDPVDYPVLRLSRKGTLIHEFTLGEMVATPVVDGARLIRVE